MFSVGGRSGDRHLYCLDAVICAGIGLTLYSLNKQGLSFKKKRQWGSFTSMCRNVLTLLTEQVHTQNYS